MDDVSDWGALLAFLSWPIDDEHACDIYPTTGSVQSWRGTAMVIVLMDSERQLVCNLLSWSVAPAEGWNQLPDKVLIPSWTKSISRNKPMLSKTRYEVTIVPWWIRLNTESSSNERWLSLNLMPCKKRTKSRPSFSSTASRSYKWANTAFVVQLISRLRLETSSDSLGRTMFGLLQRALREEVLSESGRLHDQWSYRGYGLRQRQCDSTVARINRSN